MSVRTVAQIVKRVQILLDDPRGVRFTRDYILPYIDQENEAYEITLERLGIQQQEQIAILQTIGPATPPNDGSNPPIDLSNYLNPGQPLEFLLRPKMLWWKIKGYPDTGYAQSNLVDELDDCAVGTIGCPQYRWAQGSIQVTPTGSAVTLRIAFFALATDLADSAQSVMRGIGFILATQVAAVIAAGNNNMGKLQQKLERNLARDKQNLSTLMVMQGQSKLLVPRGTKRGAAVQISAGGTPYI